MACLLAGIMLARPVALFMSGSFGWRSVFWCSAGLMAVVGILLAALMPRHRPESGLHYWQILRTVLSGGSERSPKPGIFIQSLPLWRK